MLQYILYLTARLFWVSPDYLDKVDQNAYRPTILNAVDQSIYRPTIWVTNLLIMNIYPFLMQIFPISPKFDYIQIYHEYITFTHFIKFID